MIIHYLIFQFSQSRRPSRLLAILMMFLMFLPTPPCDELGLALWLMFPADFVVMTAFMLKFERLSASRRPSAWLPPPDVRTELFLFCKRC